MNCFTYYQRYTKILDFHHLWSRIPPCSGCFIRWFVSSAFFRQYLRNLGWFLFLKVLRCFSSLRFFFYVVSHNGNSLIFEFSLQATFRMYTRPYCVLNLSIHLKLFNERGDWTPDHRGMIPTFYQSELSHWFFTFQWRDFFCHPKRNQHRLRRWLPGYLILFAPHAFAPQCQIQTRRLPSHLIFLLISKNLTSPLEILSSSFDLKIKCIDCKPNANNWNGTINNNYPPTCPLRPIILNNTCSSCLTAAAGTEFAGASFWR